MTSARLQTVVETPEFIKQASRCLSENAKNRFIEYIASHPRKGDIITGTPGARKIRWASDHQGKRGGARVIYYHHNEPIPIFLFTAYGKNERANLSCEEKNAVKTIIKQIVMAYKNSEVTYYE